jgi:hypothetical protein
MGGFKGTNAVASAAAAAADPAAASDVEVYANGVAFDVVKGWLGRGSWTTL